MKIEPFFKTTVGPPVVLPPIALFFSKSYLFGEHKDSVGRGTTVFGVKVAFATYFVLLNL